MFNGADFRHDPTLSYMQNLPQYFLFLIAIAQCAAHNMYLSLMMKAPQKWDICLPALKEYLTRDLTRVFIYNGGANLHLALPQHMNCLTRMFPSAFVHDELFYTQVRSQLYRQQPQPCIINV